MSLDDCAFLVHADPRQVIPLLPQATGAAAQLAAAPCPWGAAVWGGGSSLAPYPTGEQIFHSSGANNPGHFADPQADKLIEASLTGGATELQAYEEYLAEQLPVLWVPNPTYQLSMVRTDLQGAAQQSPYSALTPERWHWKEAAK